MAQQHIDETFQMHIERIKPLLKELDKWAIEHEFRGENEEELRFSVQSGNVIRDILIYIPERMSEEERLFMFTAYPFVSDFESIQMRIFGKVIWNWR